MEEILKSLGLSYLEEKFFENNINQETVLLLQDSELKELIPKIGDRAKLRKYISEKCDTHAKSPADSCHSHSSSAGTELSLVNSEDGVSAVRKTSSEYLSSDTDIEIAQLATTRETFQQADASCNRVKKILRESIDGRVILKEGESSGGLLTEGARRKLSQLIIHHTLDKNPFSKIKTEEFCKLATEIVEVFRKESVILYYSAYQAGTDQTRKKNASGKLYESYVTRRRKLRQSGELQETSRASSVTSSISKSSCPSSDECDTVDQSTEDNLTWLNNNVDPWQSVQKKWTETHEYRVKKIYDGGSIAEYFNKYPALKQPLGYILLQDDFNLMYPEKQNKLFSTLNLKQEDIIAYAKGKAERSRNDKFKKEVLNLLGNIRDNDSETAKNICLMLLAYVINVSPVRKRKGTAALKFSRAEICDGFIKHVSSESQVTDYIINKKEQFVKQKRTLQPFVICVGPSIAELNAAYVVVNDTVYRLEKLVTAIDCVFKIFQSTGACYPEESENLWLFVQLGFYNITTKFDRPSQVVNTLLTDLGLVCD